MLDAMRAILAGDEAPGGNPVLFVYDDATGAEIRPGSVLQGHPTIGIGRCLDMRGVTAAEAQLMFGDDIAAAEARLASIPTWRRLDPVRQAALTNMCFNLGFTGLLRFRDMWTALARAVALPEGSAAASRAFTDAAAAALDSDWARRLAADGSPRATRIASQIRGGQVQPS